MIEIGKDTCNLQFWSLHALSNTFNETKSQLQEVSYARDLIRESILKPYYWSQEHLKTTAINRATDVLNKNGKSQPSQPIRLVLSRFHCMTVFDYSSCCSESVSDNVVTEDITFYETLSNSTIFSKDRHHLFNLAYSLVSNWRVLIKTIFSFLIIMNV